VVDRPAGERRRDAGAAVDFTSEPILAAGVGDVSRGVDRTRTW